MSRKSSEDEYAALEEEEKLLLADIYPELKKKLERSVERSRKKRVPVRHGPSKPQPVFDISSDEEVENIKKKIAKAVEEIDDDKEVRGMLSPLYVNTSANGSKQSEEYSFHSARSNVHHGNAGAADESMLSDDMSPPHSFVADEQEQQDEMDGSFVYNPVWSRSRSNSSYEQVDGPDPDEQEPEGESLNERDGRGRREEEEDSIHSSDAEFIDDDEGVDESEMSIDRSFQPDVVMETPPNRRVLPSRSTRNQHFTTGKSMPVPMKNKENLAAISPSAAVQKKEEDESDGSGEESFEMYLRKLKDEDERKKREREEQLADLSDDGEGREDSFVVDDDSDDVIDDEFENESGEDEEEGEWDRSSECSHSDSDEDKENKRTKEKTTEEKPTKKRNLLLDLADSFNSPSVRAVNKEARDPDRHFLLSLADNYEGTRRHVDAEIFVKRGVKGEKTRMALVQKLFEIYNREIFEEKLPSNMSITFNARLRKTAGYCKMSIRSMKVTIELSPKVCSKPERIRDTLAHEMCHAAVFVINKLVKEGHGAVWKSWTRKFSSRFRGLPVPSRCHSYEIEAKFIYECEGCGQLIKRHSKSLDTEKKGCGRCHGRFRLRENTDGKKRGANAFALYVKDNYGDEKKNGASHKEIMQVLSARFKTSKTVETKEGEEEDREVKRLDLDLSVMSIHED